jgi:hypothetical protein
MRTSRHAGMRTREHADTRTFGHAGKVENADMRTRNLLKFKKSITRIINKYLSFVALQYPSLQVSKFQI